MHMNTTLLRSLGLKEATAIVVGTILGTGIFLKTAVMAQATGSAFWVFVAWAVAGALSLTGALTYGELGGLFPRAGGEYVYLREAYGPMWGFLYGWMRFWIGSPGSIAAYAVGAATFSAGLLPLSDTGDRAALAISIIILFTAINCFTVAFGGWVQTAMTLVKVGMIFGLTVALLTGAQNGTWQNLVAPEGHGGWPGWSAFGTALLAALWAYDGWNNLPMAAGEIRDPGRVIPRALGLGMISLLIVYGLANLAYFYALPFAEVVTGNSTAFPNALPVATKAAETVFGPIGVTLLSAAFVFSAVGALNGSVLTSARVPFAMARDGSFFKWLGTIHPTTRVPMTALIVQGVWSCMLALSGTFDQLTNYVVFASWIFYALVTASVFIFRQKLPNAHRSYLTPGYPWLPAIFLLSSVFLLVSTLIVSPQESLIGLALITAGIPVYFFFHRTRKD